MQVPNANGFASQWNIGFRVWAFGVRYEVYIMHGSAPDGDPSINKPLL